MKTWKELLKECLKKTGEHLKDIDLRLARKDVLGQFPLDGGPEDGFVGFSEKWVYICQEYDSSFWVQAIPRHPESVLKVRVY